MSLCLFWMFPINSNNFVFPSLSVLLSMPLPPLFFLASEDLEVK